MKLKLSGGMMAIPMGEDAQREQFERARKVIADCQAAGVPVGTGTDLLLDNMPDLQSVEDARRVLRAIGYVEVDNARK